MHNCFEKIISVENLLEAWSEFIKGKKNKTDVQQFSLKLMDNILSLHNDLLQRKYKHLPYTTFSIHDPKPRKIRKAFVRDRLIHHAIYRVLYPYFDKKFISESFSCRLTKGTLKAINIFKRMFYKVSKNNTKTCWVLKCDIKKFFDSVDHDMLFNILKGEIADQDTLWLLREIICSFNCSNNKQLSLFESPPIGEANRCVCVCVCVCGDSLRLSGKGIPIGNLTSQLFANIYMNEFDQFLKHRLKVTNYIRFADDFVILSDDRIYLENLLPKIEKFLERKLKLKIHKQKFSIKTFSAGADFLGWVNFPDHKVLRTTSKKRMMRRIKESQTEETINSYLGLMSHGNTNKIKEKFLDCVREYINKP